MKILLLGATGRVGQEILSNALIENHCLTALVRTPAKLQATHENLTVLQGNALKKDDIFRAMDGIDVVISALNTDGTNTLSESMPLIIQGMKKEGVKRIITIGTAGILQSRTTPTLLRYQSTESKRKSKSAAEEHHKAYELLKQSTLDWTIVCPTYLPDGDRVGQYRVEIDFLPEDGVAISVQDTAEFAFSLLNSSDYMKSRVGIAY